DDDQLDPGGEVWQYVCTAPVPDHSAGEDNPVHNTATASGFDSKERTVTATSSFDTKIIHPAIAVEKTPSPEVAHVGDTLTVTVTHPGAVPLTQVTVEDPKCDGDILGPTGDTEDDASLGTDESWAYTCTHVVTADDGDVLTNTVTVTGLDPLAVIPDPEKRSR